MKIQHTDIYKQLPHTTDYKLQLHGIYFSSILIQLAINITSHGDQHCTAWQAC